MTSWRPSDRCVVVAAPATQFGPLPIDIGLASSSFPLLHYDTSVRDCCLSAPPEAQPLWSNVAVSPRTSLQTFVFSYLVHFISEEKPPIRARSFSRIPGPRTFVSQCECLCNSGLVSLFLSLQDHSSSSYCPGSIPPPALVKDLHHTAPGSCVFNPSVTVPPWAIQISLPLEIYELERLAFPRDLVVTFKKCQSRKVPMTTRNPPSRMWSATLCRSHTAVNCWPPIAVVEVTATQCLLFRNHD